jgi:hypothetical protein
MFEANTVLEAEAFIAGMEVHAPELVHAGTYGINADEEADAVYQQHRGGRSMNSTQAAKLLAEAAHAALDTVTHVTEYTSFIGAKRAAALTEALDAYDERIAFEAGTPAVAEPEKCGHGLFEVCPECFVDDGDGAMVDFHAEVS